MRRAVIITGTNGGIGKALKNRFTLENYAVIGIGRSADKEGCDDYIQIDFSELSLSSAKQEWIANIIVSYCEKYELHGLINNSAIQTLNPVSKLSFIDFQKTIAINLSIPFLFSKICFNALANNKGAIVNIGSIHAKLTKPEFVAYATSKGGLETMTRAMAVDMGGDVRVNLIAPAAIDTKMLKDGFIGNDEGYQMLKDYHPSKDIGMPEDVALLCFRLVDDQIPFLTGAAIDINGAIGSRLHDPS